jgi:glycosyltransferase involved in cell wall biosynthesis
MRPDFTVVIVTHDRPEALRDTLAAVARLSCPGQWETLVVDNGSAPPTAEVVVQARRTFPVALHYLYEPRRGKYFALNTAIARSNAAFIAATDDDAAPAVDWLERAADGFSRYGCDFVGGRVYPIWERTPPGWLTLDSAITGKVLGLLDHGPFPREFGRDGISWPLGVNVAYRREVFDRVGPFEGRLGRVAGTLRNQAQREWHIRARSAGVRGMYLPDMVVGHHVPADRLKRHYFHRWFYWHGISRSILNQTTGLHLLRPEGDETHLGERHVAGLPASIWRAGAAALLSAGSRWLRGRFADALEYELQVCFCAGVARQRWSWRRGLPASAPEGDRHARVPAENA